MDPLTLFYAFICLVGYGLGSFLAKIASTRIGERAVFWDMVGYVPGVVLYCFLTFRAHDLAGGNKGGIAIAMLAGLAGSIATVAFYLAVTRKDASVAVPITALYPALTAILAFLFLKESMTLAKVSGILLAVVAIILLGI